MKPDNVKRGGISRIYAGGGALDHWPGSGSFSGGESGRGGARVRAFLLVVWIVIDVTWWRWADRALRPVRGARAWRTLLGVFTAAQLAYLLVFLVAIQIDADWWWPTPLAVGAYLWHLGVVLATVIAAGSWKL